MRRTLEQIGIPRATFYRWYDLYQTGGPDALEDRSPKPGRVWNRIPDDVRGRILQLALDEPELSPRELAVHFTDTKPDKPEPRLIHAPICPNSFDDGHNSAVFLTGR